MRLRSSHRRAPATRRTGPRAAVPAESVSTIRLRLRNTDLDWREVEGELVALDLRESRYLAVNETGKQLWGALGDGATHDELVNRLVESFGVERSRAAADVDAFVADLDARGLIVREDDG